MPGLAPGRASIATARNPVNITVHAGNQPTCSVPLRLDPPARLVPLLAPCAISSSRLGSLAAPVTPVVPSITNDEDRGGGRLDSPSKPGSGEVGGAPLPDSGGGREVLLTALGEGGGMKLPASGSDRCVLLPPFGVGTELARFGGLLLLTGFAVLLFDDVLLLLLAAPTVTAGGLEIVAFALFLLLPTAMVLLVTELLPLAVPLMVLLMLRGVPLRLAGDGGAGAGGGGPGVREE
jgi:hypothetical protein